MYKWQRIKALHTQGVSIRQIARDVGVSRNTVRKYLKEASPPQFKAREYIKELDKYLEDIEAMLAKGYIGTRVYNELVAKVYQAFPGQRPPLPLGCQGRRKNRQTSNYRAGNRAGPADAVRLEGMDAAS